MRKEKLKTNNFKVRIKRPEVSDAKKIKKGYRFFAKIALEETKNN